MMIYNLLQSVGLLADAADSFRERCVDGIEANEDTIARKNARVADAGDRARRPNRL